MRAITTALLLVSALALGGCGSENAGGETTCGDYLEMDVDTQNAVVRAWLDERGEADPTGVTVTANRLGALAFCNSLGKASDPINSVTG